MLVHSDAVTIPEEPLSEVQEELTLTTDLDQNEKMLKHIFANSADFVCRNVRIEGQLRWMIIYFATLVEEKIVNDNILEPLLSGVHEYEWLSGEYDSPDVPLIAVGKTLVSAKVNDIVRKVLNGHAAVLTAGNRHALIAEVIGTTKRALGESSSEPIIRGPKDGFIENIGTNIGLIRSRLKTPKLKMEAMTIGELSQTYVVITYIVGVVSETVLEEVRTKLSRIQTEAILESGYIEEFIEDHSFSPFPQVHSTERPDVVVAGLLEGKVAILTDTTPFALLVPMTFWSGLQASEDYYLRQPIATFIRWIRFLFIIIAVFAPPLYVAITTFHQEMIPTNLVLSIASSREEVPFPAVIEALFTEIVFEALREAGIRLPKQLGSAISIIGALVIGQSAVAAGIISAPVVIIVSITGIAAFTIPRYSFANGIRLLRFPMLILAGTLGLYGIVLGFLAIVIHVTALRSFGVPYFSPILPLSLKGFKSILFRQAKIPKPSSNNRK
ncbi:spore germination protein [Paenibacillus aestuarii]|uniref:Spore germination protein n=1 Tax=Paenibacillus aestuarii TaxID=516965 RepID=A0ABW0K8G0_9BACL|nr:spore germination protein [Paenibacillus aestuarii]